MTENENLPEELKEFKGAFVSSLTRNNKKIRTDRAVSITEETQMLYKRQVEDLMHNIKKMERQRDARLDLSPADSTSLIPAKDFDASNFIEDDMRVSLSLENERIKLRIANARYEALFGESLVPKEVLHG